MIYLLDTTIFSALMRRHPAVEENVGHLGSGDSIIISAITLGEIEFGIQALPKGKKKENLEREVIHLLSLIPCFGLPPESASIYGELKLQTLKESLGLNENDLWIASHGFSLNATVVTSDNDFAKLSNLSVQNWIQ